MKHKNIFLISCCIIISSCTVTREFTSKVLPEEVKDLKLLEPCCYIEMIKKGNRGQVDDSISNISKQLNVRVLKSYNGKIPITGDIFFTDSTINRNLKAEYDSLFLNANKKKKIKDLKITPTLDKILEANNARFGLIVVNTGFTRVKGNYGKEIAKGAALGILTLGMYYQIPIKAYSVIYAMIVDSKDNNIAFYKKAFIQDNEPLKPETLTKQYNFIFEGYFWRPK
jgi:hypothetical protein